MNPRAFVYPVRQGLGTVEVRPFHPRRPSFLGRLRRRIRRTLSPFAVAPGAQRDTIRIRVRWWGWPFVLVPEMFRRTMLRPRWKWLIVAPWILAFALWQSVRSLVRR